MNIIYGLPRTGSHFVARHLANKNNKIFLGEYFKSPIPNAQVNIIQKIDTLPKNSVIIVHPDLAYGNYPDEFYDWLLNCPLDLTETKDIWRQMLSWGMAASIGHYQSFNNKTSDCPKIQYKRDFFDMFKISFKKYHETKDKIKKIRSITYLQDIPKLQTINGRYKLPTKTFSHNTKQLFDCFLNKNDILEWYNELERINESYNFPT